MYRSNRGFTTFELLVVGLMATVLVAVAVPGIQRSIDSTRLNTSAKELQTELDFARSMAVSRNSVYQMAVDQTGRSYQIVDPYSDVRPRGPRRLDKGVYFQQLPSTPITFFPRGHARQGELVLQNSFGERIRIEVGPSGMIRATRTQDDGTEQQTP